jgi:hypothetical protein
MMTRREFNRQWDAVADEVAANIIRSMALPGEKVRRGWRWKVLRVLVIGRTRVTLRWRRRVI